MLTGCAQLRQSDFTMWIANGNLTYVPTKFLGGNHEFKVGYHLSMRDITGNVDQTPKNKSGFGDYNLMFDTVGGIPNQSAEFEAQNAPITPDNWDNVYSFFITDQWRLGAAVDVQPRHPDRSAALVGTRAEPSRGRVVPGGDVPARRSRPVDEPRTSGGGRVGRDWQRPQRAEEHLRMVQQFH